MVKEFAKAAVQGQPFHLVNQKDAGDPLVATYSIDRSLSLFTVKPEDGDAQKFEMFNIQELLKESVGTPYANLQYSQRNDDFEKRFICIQHVAAGEQAADGNMNSIGILLPNAYERERFYTCMKVLRWAMDSRRTRV